MAALLDQFTGAETFPASLDPLLTGRRRFIVDVNPLPIANTHLSVGSGTVELGELREWTLLELKQRSADHGITDADRGVLAKADPRWGEGPYYAWLVERIAKEGKFEEGKHPRAANGQFGSGGGGGGASADDEKKPEAKKPEVKKPAEEITEVKPEETPKPQELGAKAPKWVWKFGMKASAAKVLNKQQKNWAGSDNKSIDEKFQKVPDTIIGGVHAAFQNSLMTKPDAVDGLAGKLISGTASLAETAAFDAKYGWMGQMYLQDQYAGTQHLLAQKGVKELTVYRPLPPALDKNIQTAIAAGKHPAISTQSIFATYSSLEEAKKYGNHVVEMKVPVEQVFAHHETSGGAFGKSGKVMLMNQAAGSSGSGNINFPPSQVLQGKLQPGHEAAPDIGAPINTAAQKPPPPKWDGPSIASSAPAKAPTPAAPPAPTPAAPAPSTSPRATAPQPEPAKPAEAPAAPAGPHVAVGADFQAAVGAFQSSWKGADLKAGIGEHKYKTLQDAWTYGSGAGHTASTGLVGKALAGTLTPEETKQFTASGIAVGDAMQAYAGTQKLLADKGIKNVTLYRAVDEVPKDGKLHAQSASSWSTDPDTAGKFGKHVVAITVPASQLLVHPEADSGGVFAKRKEAILLSGGSIDFDPKAVTQGKPQTGMKPLPADVTATPDKLAKPATPPPPPAPYKPPPPPEPIPVGEKPTTPPPATAKKLGATPEAEKAVQDAYMNVWHSNLKTLDDRYSHKGGASPGAISAHHQWTSSWLGSSTDAGALAGKAVLGTLTPAEESKLNNHLGHDKGKEWAIEHYAGTQKLLADKGITSTTLYRGIGGKQASAVNAAIKAAKKAGLDYVDVAVRHLSSFTTKHGGVGGFGSGGIKFKVDVPVEHHFADHRVNNKFQNYGESEVVVLSPEGKIRVKLHDIIYNHAAHKAMEVASSPALPFIDDEENANWLHRQTPETMAYLEAMREEGKKEAALAEQRDAEAQKAAQVAKMLRREENGWNVYSEDGSKHLGGPYKDKEEAVARLRQVEGHKAEKSAAGARPELRITLKRRIDGNQLHGELGIWKNDTEQEWWGLQAFREGSLPGGVDLDLVKRLEKSGAIDGDRYTQPVLAPASCSVLLLKGELTDGQLLDAASHTAEPGIWSDSQREFFLTGENEQSAGRWALTKGLDGNWAVQLQKTGLPSVLSGFGDMPALGSSALPLSMEEATPPEYRYWTAKSDEEARACRDALVESGWFSRDNVSLTNGQLRRVETKRYLYEAKPTSTVKGLAKPMSLAQLVGRVCPPDIEMEVLSPQDPTTQPAAQLVAKAAALRGDFLLESPDSPQTRSLFAKVGRPFTLRGPAAVGRVFCASFPLASMEGVDWVDETMQAASSLNKKSEPSIADLKDSIDRLAAMVQAASPAVPAPERVQKFLARLDAGMEMRIFKGQDERYTLGIVLEPEVQDGQNDVYSHEEVKSACHRYLMHSPNVGLMHKELVNGKVRIVENYIAPVDFQIGEEKVKKGTWLMGHYWPDDQLWGLVKSGKLTGLSIGGSAIRKPDPLANASSP